MADEILCEVKDHIATVTMNRPEKRNALNAIALQQMEDYLHRLNDDPDVRVVVIRGAGKAFCAGRDLREMGQQQASDKPPPEVSAIFHQVEELRYPTIAMVQGDALAGGCELALHCDLRLMAEEARMGMPLARLGLIPPVALTGKLVDIIGPAHTRQILLTAQPVDGIRAFEIGMVHQTTPLADLETATYELAATIAANAPQALAGIKKVLLRLNSLKDQIEHEDLD